MVRVKRPGCDEWVGADEVCETLPDLKVADLSPAAFAILSNKDNLPLDFVRGQRSISLRVLAGLLGYFRMKACVRACWN